jgi:hypothetical protein
MDENTVLARFTNSLGELLRHGINTLPEDEATAVLGLLNHPAAQLFVQIEMPILRVSATAVRGKRQFPVFDFTCEEFEAGEDALGRDLMEKAVDAIRSDIPVRRTDN